MKFRLSICVLVAVGLATADEVTDWNQVLIQATLTSPITPAPFTPRVTAIVQAAIFDALNGVDRHYTSIYVHAAAAPGTSKRAAAVQAAYATLVNIYPAQKAKFDQQRTASLAAIGDTDDAIQKGLSWGQNVADQIWVWRSQDGFSNTLAPYLGGTQPGQWRPTLPAMASGLAPQLATSSSWVMRSPSQFRPAGSPALTSDQYTADFNEVKNMGVSTNSGRTAEQTLFANFGRSGIRPTTGFRLSSHWPHGIISPCCKLPACSL